SRERKAFIDDQCHAIVAVTRRVEDLSVDSKAGKEFSAVFQFQDEVIVLLDLNIGMGFCFEEFMERCNEVTLTFQQDIFYSFILEFLHKTCMVWMEMCD